MRKAKNPHTYEQDSKKAQKIKSDFVARQEQKRKYFQELSVKYKSLRDEVKAKHPEDTVSFKNYHKAWAQARFMADRLSDWINSFKPIMANMDSSLLFADPNYLDKQFRLHIEPEPKYEYVTMPGSGRHEKETQASVDARRDGRLYYVYEDLLQESGKLDSNGYPIISGGEAPPKAQPASKPESKPQTTQPTQTAPTPPEPDPEDVSLAQVLDETEAKIPD